MTFHHASESIIVGFVLHSRGNVAMDIIFAPHYLFLNLVSMHLTDFLWSFMLFVEKVFLERWPTVWPGSNKNNVICLQLPW